MRTWTYLGIFVTGTLLMPLLAAAQPAGAGAGGPGGPGGFGPGGPGGRGGFNMVEMVREQLGATADEWKVIEPKLQKVIDTQRLVGPGRGGRGGRGPGGPGGPGGRGPGGPGGPPPADDPVSKAMADLRTTVENSTSTNEAIQTKLTAFRTAREKARGDLVEAQKDLKGVLTPRQEAVLVTLGFLD